MPNLIEFLRENKDSNKDIINAIIKNNKRKDIIKEVEKKSKEYVSKDWEKEADTELEWYEKYGRGEAENDVALKIINNAAEEVGITLNDSRLADLMNWFYNTYSDILE